MSSLFCLLTAVDGVEWRFSYTCNYVYLAAIHSGSCSICSPHITHDIASGEKQFSLYLANSFINFPISELKKFKDFYRQTIAVKDAA